MAVYDKTTTDSAANSSSRTFAHDTASGANRVMIVAVTNMDVSGTRQVTSITYNGVSLTLIRRDRRVGANVDIVTELWRLVAPATGSNNVIVTMNGGADALLIAAHTFTEVDQTTPIDANTGATGSSTTPSNNITTGVDNALIIDVIGCSEDTNGMTPDGSQVERFDFAVGGFNDRSAGSTLAGGAAGSHAMGWSSVTTIEGYAQSIISLNSILAVKITKSLKYSVVKGIKLTKSLQYTIDDGLVYTREGKDSLPTNDTDLATIYSLAEKADVATDNGVRVTLNTVDNIYNIHQFRHRHENNTDSITVTVDMQTEQAPSSRTVTLQIYDFNGATWETIDTDSTTGADTDFVLTGSPSGAVANYYNGSNEVVIRAYQ